MNISLKTIGQLLDRKLQVADCNFATQYKQSKLVKACRRAHHITNITHIRPQTIDPHGVLSIQERIMWFREMICVAHTRRSNNKAICCIKFLFFVADTIKLNLLGPSVNISNLLRALCSLIWLAEKKNR